MFLHCARACGQHATVTACLPRHASSDAKRLALLARPRHHRGHVPSLPVRSIASAMRVHGAVKRVSLQREPDHAFVEFEFREGAKTALDTSAQQPVLINGAVVTLRKTEVRASAHACPHVRLCITRKKRTPELSHAP